TQHNSGTVRLTNADLTVTQSGGSFSNTGQLDLGGRTLTFFLGTFNFDAGSITGGGTLSLSSATAKFTPDFSTADTALLLNSATVNGPGTLTNVASKTLELRSSTINAPLVNQGTLLVRGDNSVNGTLTTAAGSVIRVQSDDTFSTFARLTVAQGFTNQGAIELTSTGTIFGHDSRLTVSSGTLSNAAGATISSLPGDNGGNRQLDVQLDNQGTLAVQQTLSMNTGLPFANAGNVTIAAGSTLTVVGDFEQTAAGSFSTEIGDEEDDGQGQIVATG